MRFGKKVIIPDLDVGTSLGMSRLTKTISSGNHSAQSDVSRLIQGLGNTHLVYIYPSLFRFADSF